MAAPQAEADLVKALALEPDQPFVLNYLGYSWVDQGLNLDEGMRMIKRAVEQRAGVDVGDVRGGDGGRGKRIRRGRLRQRRCRRVGVVAAAGAGRL